MSQPEAWLRGPVDGVIEALQPVAHSLIHSREEFERVLPALTSTQVSQRPGNIASISYHVRHSMGSLDRFLTYLRGEGLSDEQFEQLKAEKEERPDLDGAALLVIAQNMIERALAVVKTTRAEQLDEPRAVGRKQLPTNVRGLFGEMAVHTARHVGQAATTAKLV